MKKTFTIDGAKKIYVQMQARPYADKLLHLQGAGKPANRDYGVSAGLEINTLDLNSIQNNIPSLAGTKALYFQIYLRATPKSIYYIIPKQTGTKKIYGVVPKTQVQELESLLIFLKTESK